MATHKHTHLQGAQKLTQKPTLQKSVLSPTQGRQHDSLTIKGYAYNTGFCAIAGRQNAASTFCSLLCGISSVTKRCWSAVVNINKNNYFQLRFGANGTRN